LDENIKIFLRQMVRRRTKKNGAWGLTPGAACGLLFYYSEFNALSD
jgi:hypothetical protein